MSSDMLTGYLIIAVFEVAETDSTVEAHLGGTAMSTGKLGTCEEAHGDRPHKFNPDVCVNWREQPAQGEPCTIETFNESSPGTIKPEPVTVSVPAQPEGGEKP